MRMELLKTGDDDDIKNNSSLGALHNIETKVASKLGLQQGCNSSPRSADSDQFGRASSRVYSLRPFLSTCHDAIGLQ